MSVSLYKFDLKGNLILSLSPVLADVVLRTAYGLETDGIYFWIISWDSGIYYNHMVNKKGAIIKSSTSDNAYGITTNRKDLITSSVGSNNFSVSTKSYNKTRTVAGATTYKQLTFNGQDVLALRTATDTVDTLDQRTFTVKRSVAVAVPNTPTTGICTIHDRLVIIDIKNINYFTYAGTLIKSIALPTTLGNWGDVCHDRDFLWIASTKTVPPVE